MGQISSCERPRAEEKEKETIGTLARRLEKEVEERNKLVEMNEGLVERLKKEEEERKKLSEMNEGLITRLKEEESKREKWIKHYCSSHKIILVGEGDFSFSLCLAKAFGSASNMVATSLDTSGQLMRNYEMAIRNVCELEKNGCKVIYGVNATTMADHFMLQGQKFDRIIFNFPHTGFYRDDSRESLITRNQKLINLFFENAKVMLSEEGEIHVTNKSEGFFQEWNIKTLASLSELRLLEEVEFELEDYAGYSIKCGYGYNWDKKFECNPSTTYKFRLQQLPPTKKEDPFEGRRSTRRTLGRW